MSQKILIIEDDEDVLDLEVMILENEGYEVKTVMNPLLAIDTALNIMPNLILLDLNLPNLTGWELYDQFRSNDTLSSIPIAIVTAQDEGIDKMVAVMKNTDAYITKPFGPKQLITIVNKLCS
jgi:DNA-binding response OmpR family regulator